MEPRFNLRILADFASAHSLRDYPGDCRRLHGHNWKVEVEVEAIALDSVGMGMDFKTIKRETKLVADRLDHQYLNDMEPFKTVNPTAENIAVYFYKELTKVLNMDTAKVRSVTIWETDRACVKYSENV